MNEIQAITDALLKFRNDRNWAQFHNPKDLAAGLSIEAAELQECFLWKSYEEADLSKVREELADVLSFSFLLAHHYGFDIETIIAEKMEHNAKKYPVDKAKGNAKKYTEL